MGGSDAGTCRPYSLYTHTYVVSRILDELLKCETMRNPAETRRV